MASAQTLLLRGVDVFDGEALRGARDVAVRAGRIASIDLAGQAHLADARLVDATGLLLLPGLTDLHCNLIAPGGTCAAALANGTRAAAAGGFTNVVCIPGAESPVDNPDAAAYIRDTAAREGYCRVSPVGCLTRGRLGQELADFAGMYSVGVRVFSDGAGDTARTDMLLAALRCLSRLRGVRVLVQAQTPELAPAALHEGVLDALPGLPELPALGEDIATARAVLAALAARQPLQATQISSGTALRMLNFAKQLARTAGWPELVTGAVSYQHLLLTQAALRNDGAPAQLSPPLRSEADRQRLLLGIPACDVDAITTGHALQQPQDNSQEQALVPAADAGWDHVLGLVLQHLVGQPAPPYGAISLEQVLRLLTSAPAEILNGRYQPPAAANPVFQLHEIMNETGRLPDFQQLARLGAEMRQLGPQFFERLVEHPQPSMAGSSASTPDGAAPAQIPSSPGRVAIGLPADLALLDPQASWTAGAAQLQPQHPVSLFEGWTVRGRVLLTLVGGRVMHAAGPLAGWEQGPGLP